MDLSARFWDDRYKDNDTAWDLGEVSAPLKAYFDQLTNKELKILIPGGGNSHEAEYLHSKGFKNVFVADLSQTALDNFIKRVPSFPPSHLINKDFFRLDKSYDLIVEQTFFCALNPNLRPGYAPKAAELLNDDGKVIGLLFNEELNTDKPPFGGNEREYTDYFKSNFKILIMEKSHNSNPVRKGKELFFSMQKKN